MPADVSIAQLRTFVRIVDRGSLSRAAADLGTTQPTVSRQLKGLEAAYGMQLLIRTTRSLTLTEAGRLLHQQGRRIIEADDALRESLLGEVRDIGGRLRISAPSGFGALFVAPSCARFVERHSAVALDLLLTDRHVDLVSEGVDVAVRIGRGRLPSSSLFARRVATLEEVIVVHPRHVKQRPIARPDDLPALPWVAHSGVQDGYGIRLEHRRRRHLVKVLPRLTIDQVVGYREALLAGAGAGLIHRYAVDSDLRAGRLVQLLPGWQLPEWAVHMLFPVRSQTGRLRRWCEELAADLASAPGVRRA